MPQMAPLNWLTLFIMFVIVFLVFNSINYFTFLYPTKEKKTQIKKLSYNWKW